MPASSACSSSPRARVVPRVRRTDGEIDAVLAGPARPARAAGPSGAPTRGRLDVLPTGRNFYSVDPRALPSELSWEVGQRLADALLDRHRRETGELPRMVGLVAWGTSAMRTQGDDVAEILALLGVRPVWHPETRRVTGVEVIGSAELGRPRIDVTVASRASSATRSRTSCGCSTTRSDWWRRSRSRTSSISSPRTPARTPSRWPGGWRPHAIFGSKPGTYGAGLLQLLETRDWRGDAGPRLGL
jgi:cobaltochelatase CobN